MTVTGPGPDAFRKLAAEYAVVPVWRDLAGDLHTPISLWTALRRTSRTAEAGRGDAAVLLEGVEHGTQWARYAVLALDPLTVLTSCDGVTRWSNGPPCPLPPRAESPGPDLAATLRAALDGLHAPALPELGPYGATAVAVLGGEAFRRGDRVPKPEDDALSAVEAVVVFPGTLVILDHLRQRLRLVRLVVVGDGRPPEDQHAEALDHLDRLAARIAAAPPTGPLDLPSAPAAVPVERDIPDDRYATLLQQAHAHVRAGEVDQLSISRRYVVKGPADPLAVYRMLRATNPSPTLYLARFTGLPAVPDLALVGASPQGLVAVRDGRVSTRAIGGTRPRGDTPEADAALEADLLADPKELAEHDMLVEAALADLAPVARPDTLRVVGRHTVIRLSAVMHLATEVTADLAEDRHPLDALQAVFPAGTVCGVPRAAALRLIDAIEPRRRGLYGGAVGCLGLSGTLDLSLGIRTLHITPAEAAVQAGAAIVAGSAVPAEVRESATKSHALTRATALARALAD